MKTIKVGVIGCGQIAESNHLPAFRSAPSVKILAIADVDEHRLVDVSKKFDVKKRYTDYHTLLEREDKIDAVSICLPTYLHKKAVITAAEAHKHILCEKPLACTVDEGREMIRAANKNDVRLYVGYCGRFSKVYELLKKNIHEGFIGTPVKVDASLSTPLPIGNWYYDRKKGGGALFDTGSHLVDLLTWIFGDAKVAYARFTKSGEAPQLDVKSVVGLMFKHGVTAELRVSWQNTEGGGSVRVEGTEGTLSASNSESTLFIHKHRSIMGRLTKGIKLLIDPGLPMHWKEIWEFVDTLRSKRPSKTLATAREGLNTLKLIRSAYDVNSNMRTNNN